MKHMFYYGGNHPSYKKDYSFPFCNLLVAFCNPGSYIKEQTSYIKELQKDGTGYEKDICM
jgi:hypothetical protein